MATQKDVYWVASPLANSRGNTFNEKIDPLQGERAKFARRIKKVIDPRNERYVFRKIHRWTLEVDGKCYQLSYDRKVNKIKPAPIDAAKWYNIRRRKEIEPGGERLGRRKRHIRRFWTKVCSDYRGPHAI